MLKHLLFLAFLGISSTGGALLKDVECAAKIEAVHECSSDAWEIMDVALETPDGRPDFQERKYCNYMTAAYENCTNILHGCFPQEEINFWIDNDLSNYMDGIEEIYSNWDNQKCPPFRHMLERKASAPSASAECQTAMESFHDCRQKSLVEWEVTEDDGRPDFEERKRCNFETAWLATCPDKLLGVCKTEEEIKRMQFWELVSDKFEYENWDTDKCPAVKEAVTSWNDLKESFKNSLEEGNGIGRGLSCKDFQDTVTTKGCLVYDCTTGDMKVTMLDTCKDLINREVEKIVEERIEQCKGGM